MKSLNIEEVNYPILQFPIDMDSIDYIIRLNISNVLNYLLFILMIKPKYYKIIERENNNASNKKLTFFTRCMENLSLGLINYNSKMDHKLLNKKKK